MSPDDTKVLLVDDHEIILHGLREFIASTPGIRVCATAGSAAEALEAIEHDCPDVALLDVRLPDMDGITLCREIRANSPDVKCLMFSSFGNQDAMFEAIIAGASGYILKDARLDEVARAISTVAAGGSVLDPELTERVLDKLRLGSAVEGPEKLTDQERRVLDLMASALTNREIAAEMHLAEQTVKNYVSSILSKLGLRGRTEAAVYAANLKGSEAVRRTSPGAAQ